MIYLVTLDINHISSVERQFFSKDREKIEGSNSFAF